MGDPPSWAEVSSSLSAKIAEMRAQALQILVAMTEHVEAEIARTGADVELEPLGTVLPKAAVHAPIAMRLGVTETTALYARQPHIGERPGEKHRSWTIDLTMAPALPPSVRNGLTRVIEQVAELQGRTVVHDQTALDL